VALVVYNYVRLDIAPGEYIPIRWYLTYSVMLGTLFVLLDRGIIVI
jgi:hypothetical protein